MKPTPETDKAMKYWPSEDSELVYSDFARRLENERDEAREDLEFRRGLYKVLEEANNRLRTTNEEAVELARTLKQERDEARKALMEIEDRCVDCEDACNDIMKIREIAAKALEEAKK